MRFDIGPAAIATQRVEAARPAQVHVGARARGADRPLSPHVSEL